MNETPLLYRKLLRQMVIENGQIVDLQRTRSTVPQTYRITKWEMSALLREMEALGLIRKRDGRKY